MHDGAQKRRTQSHSGNGNKTTAVTGNTLHTGSDHGDIHAPLITPPSSPRAGLLFSRRRHKREPHGEQADGGEEKTEPGCDLERKRQVSQTQKSQPRKHFFSSGILHFHVHKYGRRK